MIKLFIGIFIILVTVIGAIAGNQDSNIASIILILAISIFLIYLGLKDVIVDLKGKKRKKTLIILSVYVVLVIFLIIFRLLAVIKEDYTEIDEYKMQALYYMDTGELDNAEKILKKVIENIGTNDTEILVEEYINLATLYIKNKKNELAKDYYNKAINLLNEGDSLYHSVFANILLLEGDDIGAINSFKKALEIDSNNYQAVSFMGAHTLLKENASEEDYKNALKYNKKAYELQKNISTSENLAINYYYLSEYKKAFDLFEYILTLQPNHSTAQYFIGFIYYINGNYKDANIYLNQAIQLDPELMSEEVHEILDKIQ